MSILSTYLYHPNDYGIILHVFKFGENLYFTCIVFQLRMTLCEAANPKMMSPPYNHDQRHGKRYWKLANSDQPMNGWECMFCHIFITIIFWEVPSWRCLISILFGHNEHTAFWRNCWDCLMCDNLPKGKKTYRLSFFCSNMSKNKPPSFLGSDRFVLLQHLMQNFLHISSMMYFRIQTITDENCFIKSFNVV